jgi:hypothetical protein
MSDSIDEWDGGAIDGRDQYISDAPYWSGDGETVDVTDPDATGEVTAENVPGPSEESGADETDESENDDPEVPTWPPNPETLTEVRRRLLNGASTYEVADWVEMSDSPVRLAAIGESHKGVSAEIPPLTAEGKRREAEWVIDESKAETETETGGAEEPQERDRRESGLVTEWIADDDSADEPDPESGTETTDAEEEPEPEPEPEPDQQGSGLVSGDERPVARNPPEPETPTVPTRWLVAGVAFVAGWILSRLVRGGGDR